MWEWKNVVRSKRANDYLKYFIDHIIFHLNLSIVFILMIYTSNIIRLIL